MPAHRPHLAGHLFHPSALRGASFLIMRDPESEDTRRKSESGLGIV